MRIFSGKHLSFSKKIILFYFYTKVVAANVLDGRLFHIESIRFLKYRVFFESISELEMLVTEIFVHEPYYFYSESKNPTIYDCGGNIGLSVLYFKHLYPKAKIKVFEPSPLVVALLKKNVEENSLKDVYVYDVALSDTEGEIDLFVREGMSLATTTSVEERRGGTKVSVPKKKLSTFIDEPVDVLKIDIQLSEGPLFRDLQKAAASKHVRSILMEYHFAFEAKDNMLSNIIKFFEENRFMYTIRLNAEKPDGFKTYIITAVREE